MPPNEREIQAIIGFNIGIFSRGEWPEPFNAILIISFLSSLENRTNNK